MKVFKKLSLIIIMLVAAVVLTGCGNKNIEGSLEDIMTKLYSGIPEDQRPMMLMNVEVNEENVEYYLGTTDIEYEEALASESGIGAIAHSVVLVRVKDGANVEDVKEKIEKSINPRKWVCVGVEEEDVIVESKGNLVVLILIQDETTREKIEDSFNKLK